MTPIEFLINFEIPFESNKSCQFTTLKNAYMHFAIVCINKNIETKYLKMYFELITMQEISKFDIDNLENALSNPIFMKKGKYSYKKLTLQIFLKSNF